MTVHYAPDGFSTVTPFIMVEGANELLEFMKKAFDAEEQFVLRHADSSIWHAQVKIGDSMIMLADSCQQVPPKPCAIFLYVPDGDEFYERALQTGATSVMVPADQFYGDRVSGVTDPFGNIWWFATHIEDVPRAELENRARKFEATSPA